MGVVYFRIRPTSRPAGALKIARPPPGWRPPLRGCLRNRSFLSIMLTALALRGRAGRVSARWRSARSGYPEHAADSIDVAERFDGDNVQLRRRRQAFGDGHFL